MPADDAIRGEGVVIETLPNGTARVEMPNGHRALCFVARAARTRLPRLAVGDRVTVEFSPYDMSQGRITARQ
ncbi:MAG: translation initiation factor IF-1 [Verrucomicrobiae bacterium]|nr:translation initiation factor IF-1 [Verrucomicrobiae bacterium]